MDAKVNLKATQYLNSLARSSRENRRIICPEGAEFLYTDNHKVYMKTGEEEFTYQKELIEIICIKNELSGEYKGTGIIAPRVYAESQQRIPMHLSTQCIILTQVKDENDIFDLNKMIENVKYSDNKYDSFWLTGSSLHLGQRLLVMNRRIGGWDGSPEHPVIELLGAGGHVPCVWDGKKFASMNLLQNLHKEFAEELRFKVSSSSFLYLGGFHNTVSNELVLLYCVHINVSDLQMIQKNAYNNIKENINGIYLGEFDEVLELYKKDASNFAGGETAKSTNFPMQKNLMERIRSTL